MTDWSKEPRLPTVFERLGGADVEVHPVPSGDSRELHTFLNPNRDRPYEIEITTDELTSLCPATGHPDFCTLTVRYLPGLRCVEMKSLKLYIESFRNEGHFYEQLIYLIYRDLWEALDPAKLWVQGEFHVRGGMPAKVTINSWKPEEGEYNGQWE